MASEIIVIQIDNHEMRLLKGAWPNLSVSARMDRSPEGDRVLADDLKQLIAPLKLENSPCILMIPRRDVVLKILEFPSTDPSEIRRMLGLQIPIIVPFDETQVIYNYRILSASRAGYTTVVAGIILNQLVKKYIDAIYAVGLSIADVYISLDGNADYLRKNFLPQLQKESLCAVALIGALSSEIVIAEEGDLIFSYYLAYGQVDIKKNREKFIEAVHQALNAQERSRGKKIAMVYLDARLQDADLIKMLLREGWKGEVEQTDLYAGLPETTRSYLQEQNLDIMWMPLMGCFVKTDRMAAISFLPGRIISSKARSQIQKTAAFFAMALLCVIMLIGGVSRAVVYRHKMRLKSLEEKITALEPKLKMAEAESVFLNMVDRKDGQEHVVLDMISEIYVMIPEDVSLQYFSMGSGGILELQGIAVKDQSVNQLQSTLVASPHFQNVDLQYATKRKRFDKEYTEFKLKFGSVK